MLCPLNGNLGNFHYLTKDSTVDSHVCSVGLLSVFVKGLFLGPPFRNSTQLHVTNVRYVKMQEGLDKFARCATGSVAPAITGIDLKGNSVSLNDFKGKYVLVDFWFAGCSWCRKETPYLLKTYNAFKDKGFTIYGVSTDRREEDWKKAIEEDKSYWNQVLLQKDDVKDVLESYCIVGFPHIILVDPEGKIVAKELRGDDLYNTVEKFVNGAK